MFEFPVTTKYTANVEDEEFIIDAIFPSSALVLLTGREGTGKTRFALLATRAIATGEPFLDQNVQQGKILYMNLDRMRKRDVIDRLQEMGVEKTNILPEWVDLIHWQEGDFNILGVMTTPEGSPMTDEQNRAIMVKQEFTKYVRNHGFKLVVFDTFHKLATSAGLNEDKADDMDLICIPIRDIARDTGACVVMLHHTPVMDDSRGRGSGAIAATVDHVLSIQGHIHKKLTLDIRKTRTSNIHAFPITITDHISLNPIPNAEAGEPIGAYKALIAQRFLTLTEEEGRRKEAIAKFEMWMWINGEIIDSSTRAAHRSSVVELMNQSKQLTNYVRDHFKRENRLEIQKGKDPTYIMHY